MTNDELDDYFVDELMYLRGAFRDRWRLREPAAPPIAYHYTDLSAFTGIVKSGRIWATLTSCLNDTFEVFHASALLRSVLTEEARRAHPLFREMLLPQLALDFEFARPGIADVFVASLSTMRDSQWHWSTYARQGCGVALGFRTAELLKFEQQENRAPACAFGQVIYSEEEQREFLTWAAKCWFERASRCFIHLASGVDDLNYLRACIFGNLGGPLSGYLPMMKKNGWAPDNEWRLGHGHDPNNPDCLIKYREETRKPYVELDLRSPSGLLPLAEVIIGPAFANEDSVGVVREFLHQIGCERVSVTASSDRSGVARIVTIENGLLISHGLGSRV